MVQDFGGFRVVAIIPRHKPNWPAPGVYEEEAPKRFKNLGAESNPLPVLLPGGKAISAATVRLGLGWMEIPFVATQVRPHLRSKLALVLPGAFWHCTPQNEGHLVVALPLQL